ncbi:ThiF family adenylyltransferase [Paenibacillus sp. V4I7]|uniref:ThiF family adenylyltransferase n=1 Tax=Paenibacillus sp. V4I7 TaxID=3042307 RepID=UPI002787E556|nr:ThiF family adenylyltransferase [Paenibacillus sp. V4I7]MDQ0902324.1 molybdopterin/thiamine biosynthesis adenylyltransferase [Paenibacillus sp. V4I7]
MIKEQFSRNLGIMSEEEINILQNSTISIAGCGCIGGFSAELLVRMGIGKVKLADPDVFDISNINRQCAATYESVGKSKVLALRDHLLKINPELIVEEYQSGVTKENVQQFIHGSDYVIDAIDYFEFPTSLFMHQAARKEHLYIITAVALGFGTSVLTFSPTGMSLEQYLGLPEGLSPEKLNEITFPAGNYTSSLPAYATPDKVLKWIQAKTIPTISVGQALGPGVLVSHLVLHLLNRKEPVIVPEKFELQFEL